MDVREVSRGSYEVFTELLQNIQTVHEVIAVATEYQSRIPMAVASGGQNAGVKATLKAAHIESHFEAAVTISDVQKGKPSSECLTGR